MDWFSKNKRWITGTGFFILSATLRFLAADQTQHPTGWDGYYYVMQVHSLITYGHMQSPDYSLIYPFLALITLITGDPIAGFKIGVALIGGLLTLSIYQYLLRRDIALTIVCAACSYIAFSPLITYFILQFPKNALGLVFFILFMNSLKRRGVSTAVLFLCTVLTHRMTGVFALLAIGAHGLRFISWKWILAAGAIVLALGFLPGIIHISDLARLSGQFSSMPRWAPSAFTTLFPTSLNWMFKADLIVVTLLTITSIVLMVINRRKMTVESWSWFALIIISLFPFFTFLPGDMGHRFFMIAPAMLVIFLGLVIKPVAIPAMAVAGLLLVLSIFSWRSYQPWAFDAPNNFYVQIADRINQRYSPTQYPLVIAHKGLAEIIIFKTDFDALNWLPPENIPPSQVLRITRHVLSSDFKKYLDETECQQVKTISRGYFTIPEDKWQKMVAGAKRDNNPSVMRRVFSAGNPMDPRPYFITKGKQ